MAGIRKRRAAGARKAPTPKENASPKRKASAKRDPSAVVGDLPLWFQFNRIGGSLTPAVVSSILSEADTGQPQRLVDLTHELRQKDTGFQQAMQTRELALSGLDWECAPPDAIPGGKRKRNKGQKIAEDVTKTIQAIENLPELWAHLVGEGLLFSHAHSQILWGKDGNRLFPQRFKNVASRRFIFRLEDGELRFSDTNYGGKVTDGVDLCAEFPGKFIQYRPRVNGDVAVREGLARLMVWTALFRNWDLKDWLTLAEIAWKPWRLGKFTKAGASEEDIANLESILYRMASTGSAVHPDSTEITIEWPKATGTVNSSSHKELFDTLGAEMAKAILGQTLTSDQGARGSQSLGQVHNDVRKDLLEADAKGVAQAFQTYVVKPYVEANYGTNVPVPVFRFLTEDEADVESLSRSIKNLTDAGSTTIPESWVRDQFGIPEPQDDEPCLGAVPEPAQPGGGAPTDPNAPKPDATAEKPGDAANDTPEPDAEAA